MFKKINFNSTMTVEDFDRLKGPKVISYGKTPIIQYYRITDLSYFESLFPTNFFGIPADLVLLSEIIGQGHLSPHIDHYISACVNFYLQTNDSTTYFYKKKENSQGFSYVSGFPNVFTLDQVDLVGEFKAEKNDCYILDVSSIHSVKSPNEGVRKFVTWEWKTTPFEKIKNSVINQ